MLEQCLIRMTTHVFSLLYNVKFRQTVYPTALVKPNKQTAVPFGAAAITHLWMPVFVSVHFRWRISQNGENEAVLRPLTLAGLNIKPTVAELFISLFYTIRVVLFIALGVSCMPLK